jgi:hypothetical protein
MLKIVCPEDL